MTSLALGSYFDVPGITWLVASPLSGVAKPALAGGVGVVGAAGLVWAKAEDATAVQKSNARAGANTERFMTTSRGGVRRRCDDSPLDDGGPGVFDGCSLRAR